MAGNPPGSGESLEGATNEVAASMPSASRPARLPLLRFMSITASLPSQAGAWRVFQHRHASSEYIARGRQARSRFPCSDVCILRSLSMPKNDSLQGSLDLLVLKILSRRPRLHGYAIMSAIEDWSGEVLRAEEGSLYPALHRMEEAGWIRARWITKDTGRRARIYELTAAGKKQLESGRIALGGRDFGGKSSFEDGLTCHCGRASPIPFAATA